MIIDGNKIAEETLAQVHAETAKIKKPIRLAGVMVGDNSSAKKFLELKKKAAEKVSIDFRIYEFPTNITTQKLRKEIVGIARTSVNDGVIIELPLPTHINAQYILNAVPEEKDVDVLSQKAQGTFFANRLPPHSCMSVGASRILPPAVEAVKIIFQKHKINPQGKICAIFGYGLLVGKPVSHWLASQGATVSIINEFSPNPRQLSLGADIIISGVGHPNLITADMVKDEAVIIDFAKDVDFEPVSRKVSLITPPIGGVGPIVIAAVLKNLITLLKNKIPQN